jgi:polysaccharide pyruvyl transferase WcaK-like protein
MIELAVHLKKPVFVVNSMVSDCPTTGRNLATFATAREQFAKCQAVFLRDPESLEYVRKDMPKVKAKMVPDSLFGWFSRYAKSDSSPPPNGDFLLPFPEHLESWGKLKFSEPYVCIGGNALACTDEDRAVVCYGRLVDAIVKLGVKVYLTENDSPDSFLRRVAEEKNIGLVPAETPIVACGSILAHARLFVSGRYHPSILASLGGTPCIFLGSQGHKMRSISQVLEYEDTIEFNAFPSDAEIAGIVSLARGYLADGDARRQRIRRVAEDRYEQTMRLPQHLIDALLNSQTLVEKAALR